MCFVIASVIFYDVAVSVVCTRDPEKKSAAKKCCSFVAGQAKVRPIPSTNRDEVK
jgi:hypothetical protein